MAGLTPTVWIGAALNLLIALAVWLARRWIEAPGPASPAPGSSLDVIPEAIPGVARQPAVHDDATVRRVLVAFALSGAAALSYEVIWTRALAFFIGNSTYAFSAMLTTFLCGLALEASPAPG